MTLFSTVIYIHYLQFELIKTGNQVQATYNNLGVKQRQVADQFALLLQDMVNKIRYQKNLPKNNTEVEHVINKNNTKSMDQDRLYHEIFTNRWKVYIGNIYYKQFLEEYEHKH